MKLLHRRHFLPLAAGAAALPALSRIAGAQAHPARSYPTRPVRIVVGFAPGGTTDIIARLLGQFLSERLGQPIVIDNRPGASGNLAVEAVARAPADGYTLLALTATNAINATLFDRLSFNLSRDLAMVAGLTRSALVLEVHPSVPAKTVPEFVTYAKANSSKVTMASFGNGSTSHVAGELFKMMAGVDLLHVPYRGSAPMIADLLGGQVQMTFDSLPSSIEYIRTGKLRALAVGTTTRQLSLPDIPTIADTYSGYDASTWNGVAIPRNTPAEIVDRLNRELNAGLADPRMQARIAELGATVMPGSPQEFESFVGTEIEKWGKVVRFAGIKPD
jgi:tripartite-type tricarboxylate transporter receptor subunit TctC